MTAPTQSATLTPQALAAATIALCRPGTITRRHFSDCDGSATLTLRGGATIEIGRWSWAAGGLLHFQVWGEHGCRDLPVDRFESVQAMVGVCESRAGV
ncbi:hypothetical protein ACFWPK_22560 [Nocardia sp. NPDC058519]|uniref:hypothetical protein n=1 Tax=Nocardia sp. NPDC058519 TaxID=3346535 RepID=UPI003655F063